METEMETTASTTNADKIIAYELKASEVHSKAPLLRSLELSRRLQERGISLPNPNLAEILVSDLCFSQHTPSLWKLLDQAMATRLVDPLQILALLTQKVVPQRKGQPGAYRLYLELLRRYAVTLPPSGATVPTLDMIVKSIDEALQLSGTYGLTQMDLGHAIVFFIFTLVKTLVDSVLEDCGFSYARTEMQHDNTLLALEIVEKIITNKKAQVLLRLISINMPEEFNNLVERLQLVEAHISKITSPSTINGANNSLATIQKALTYAIHRLEKHPQLGVLFNTRPQNLNFANNFSYGNSTCWIPFDVFMENAMDGRHLHVVSAIEVVTELIKGLQVLNQATWQETFQALWLSGLRHVQRGRDQVQGHIPLVDARLSILLAIVPLSIVPLVNNDPIRRLGLVTSLQVLGQFSALLTPHPAFVTLANEAATKAAVFVSNANPNIKATGNILHLIVEACIARNLIDTSAYFWPGYVVPTTQLPKEPHLTRDTPWTAFMSGAPLTASLEKFLTITAAPSVAELEKLYIFALNGSEEERPMASRILCGASLTQGWNFQEHAVDMVVKLLSPSSSLDSSEIEIENPYIRHMRMLNALLLGMNSVDAIHILSLYGLIPEVAAALMPICEAFGSLPPPSNHKSCIPEETSVYSVFSYAFHLLLRLWKFYQPPQEHCIPTRGAQELTLDYLLLLRNGCVSLRDPNAKPVYIESFPKLRAWYFQNQACISSTLSGLCNKNPVHQVANMILNMVWAGSGSGSSGSVNCFSNSSSSGSINGIPLVSGSGTTEESYQRPTLPAWEILEAIPFVLEAALTACAYGQLSSKDLTTGLRHIVDFLPASLAVFVTYFSAEITRGIWKPVHLNGIDWPSPAANLFSVELEIKEILASAGVDVLCSYPRESLPMLPLPIAVLVSLTITFRLDKNSDHIHGIIGHALEKCTSSSSWMSMPTVGALWIQKVRKWHNFVVLSCTRSPFSRDKNATAQLIKSCFTCFLGTSSRTDGSHFVERRGSSGLLGHLQVDHAPRTVPPGYLYIYSCRNFHDIHYVSEVVFTLILDWARTLADECVKSNHNGIAGRVRSDSGAASLASALSRVRQSVSLGASLLVITGGPKLVQILYEETFPTLLLLGKADSTSPMHGILSGYAVAYLLFYSGVFVWGVSEAPPAYTWVYSSKRARVFGQHMDLIAKVVEGNIQPNCQPGAWKAYVKCFVGLVVRFTPMWVPVLRLETVTKLVRGLKRWNETELALALLEQAGPAAMSAVVEALSWI